MSDQSVLVCPKCEGAHWYFGTEIPRPEWGKTEMVYECIKCGHVITLFVKAKETEVKE